MSMRLSGLIALCALIASTLQQVRSLGFSSAINKLTFLHRSLTSNVLCLSVARDEQGYEIKPREWFNGLSSDPGASLTDPRAVPLECKSFAEKIKSNDDLCKTLTYQDTIDFLDKHYTYFAVPFQCGDISYEPNVKTGAAKIFSFGLMTQMNEEQTLRLFGEYYRDLKPNDDRPNVRNFLKFGWKGISFPSGLAIVSKLQSYDDTDSALATQDIVEGNFSGPKQQEIVVAKGTILELLRPDDTGKVISINSTNVFSIIRSLYPFRSTGSNRDCVVIGSDSGKISIVEFDPKTNNWKLLHCEAFGKTGCRRIVPGQYVAADPKGRALLIAAVEKQKFVYVMNSVNNKLTISSPLEAHKAETILFSVVGVDVGHDNPVFAMIELEYTDVDQDPTGEALSEVEKKLSFYELDLGLNHVVRKWSEPISRTANFLLSVPGGDVWPSGVLICGENWVSYKNQGHVEVRTALPRRHNLPIERGVLITTGTVHKQKDMFFFILQSEYGDLYKVTFEFSPSDSKVVSNIIITVFDTIQPANSLCITKTGLLYVASEFSNHSLFQFQGIGDPNAVRSERIADDDLNDELGDDSYSAARVAPLFKASSKLQNLLLTDDINSLAPITDMMVDDLLGSESKQIYTLCGKGHHSSLRILKYGISITEMAVSELPGRPIAVWTVKKEQQDLYDQYIIVSFSNATLVLSIGDTVEEVTDSGFLATSATLQVALLADNSLVQVHANGIRHIRPDKRLVEWKTPSKRQIQIASANSRQIAIALSGGEIMYFEVDDAGNLNEVGSVDLGKEVSTLDIGVVPEGRSRSMFLAVGCWDDTVQLLTLDPNDLLGKGSAIPVDGRPTSLCLIEMNRDADHTGAGIAKQSTSLYLNIGLEKGILLRIAVDPITGDFSDARQKFLGPKAVKLCRVTVQGSLAVMALNTRPWLMYSYQNRYHQDPLSYEALEHVSDFSSEACPGGIVAVVGSTLRIVSIDNLGIMYNQSTVPLRYTPRKMCRLPNSTDLAIIESDHNEFNAAEKESLNNQFNMNEFADTAADSANEGNDEEEGTTLPLRGPIPAADGKWASCIRLLDASSGATKGLQELSGNEAAFSLCTCSFAQHSEETFLIVGSCKDLTLHPKKMSASFVSVYRLLGDTLQLLHRTEVEDIPMCMMEFQGRLVVGIGRCLRMYDLGKRKLLKKCEIRTLPTSIVRLQCQGDRIFVGDMMESVLFVKYRRNENIFVVFADDTCPRFVTSMTVLDYNTIGAVDKFGNVFTLRLPEDSNDEILGGAMASGTGLLWDQGTSNGIPNKLELLTHYYLGEAATSIVKCSLKNHGKEVLLISTISGGIYAFIPAKSKEEVNFYQHLEMFMRQESPSLCQRDHLSYRSYFHPVNHTIDGDLCEKFISIPYSKQKEFGDDVDRSPAEIIKKLEEFRDFV